MNLILNPDQETASDELFQFLLSTEKFYKVSGPGGSGKTTLMKHVMKELLPRYSQTTALMGLPEIDYEIALTATTNKAAEVLQSTTGCPAETIHSFLNLRVKDNHTTGETEITRTATWVVHSRKLIFVDEASMIDSKIKEFIEQGTDDTCKVIYLGDHCQLAPVFESTSPVYRDTTTSFSELKQLMRNAGQPALMSLCRQLRHTVETGEFYHMEEVPGVIDYLDGEQAQALIDQSFLQENSNDRILVFSNRRAQEYNAHIRDIRGYTDMYVAGERLINNTGFQLGGSGQMLRPEEPVCVLSADHTPQKLYFDDAEVNYYTLKISRGTTPNPNATSTVRIPIDAQHVVDLSKYYARQKNWTSFFGLKNAFPDLRQKDASTVHKAQGSTYGFVLIDLSNIGTCNMPEQVARMLYVAVSRPSQRIYFYGKLPPKYEGVPAPHPF